MMIRSITGDGGQALLGACWSWYQASCHDQHTLGGDRPPGDDWGGTVLANVLLPVTQPVGKGSQPHRRT